MKLRKLRPDDAPLMYEWMHDKSVVQDLKTDFSQKSIQDCQKFIAAAQDETKDLHLAIVDDADQYMGTVSLKHIDHINGIAEFAITVRKSAMGRGFAQWGMREILDLGFRQLGLKTIVWCVSPLNKRACRFYEKNGYVQTTDIPQALLENYQDGEPYLWFAKKVAE